MLPNEDSAFHRDFRISNLQMTADKNTVVTELQFSSGSDA